MSEQLKRWALRLYNDCGGYSPEMVDPQTLPDPASRTAYVLEADAYAALAAKDARIAELEAERDAWVERATSLQEKLDVATTPSEDGGEVPDFATPRAYAESVRTAVDKAAVLYRQGRSALGYMEDIAGWAICIRDRLDELSAQHSRIVAAKDAEIDAIKGVRNQYWDDWNEAASNLIEMTRERDELRAQLASQQQAEPLIDTSAWQSCNPGCDPEFNGEKGRHCVCDPAKAAMSAKKANSINPEMVDVVGYTTAGMLRISKDLPLTGRIGAKCKPDERWNVPLMTVTQHERILKAKDAELRELRDSMAFRTSLVGRLEAERDELRAQPARQVGVTCGHAACKSLGGPHPFCDFVKQMDARQVGVDEQERFRAWILSKWPNTTFQVILDTGRYVGWLEDAWLGWQARAALAPAAVAVVMPEIQHHDDDDREYATGWVRGYNEALDAVARLNRRAIPEGLLERVLESWAYTGTLVNYPKHQAVYDELRALLGKEGE